MKAFRPFDIRNGCVPNSLLFEDWLADHVPHNWRSQHVVEHRQANGDVAYHRVVLFETGGRYYVYDQSAGALPIPANVSPADRRELVAHVARRVRDILSDRHPRIAPRRTPLLKHAHRLIYEEMKRRRPVAIVSYHGNEALVFSESALDETSGAFLVGVWSEQTGTRSAEVSRHGTAEGAARLLLQSFWHDDGVYQIVAGEIATPGRPAPVAAFAPYVHPWLDWVRTGSRG